MQLQVKLQLWKHNKENAKGLCKVVFYLKDWTISAQERRCTIDVENCCLNAESTSIVTWGRTISGTFHRLIYGFWTHFRHFFKLAGRFIRNISREICFLLPCKTLWKRHEIEQLHDLLILASLSFNFTFRNVRPFCQHYIYVTRIHSLFHYTILFVGNNVFHRIRILLILKLSVPRLDRKFPQRQPRRDKTNTFATTSLSDSDFTKPLSDTQSDHNLLDAEFSVPLVTRPYR